MTQQIVSPWQTQVADDLDRVQTPRTRISSAGKCIRRLAYAHTGTTESNPPDQQALNRMAMGHMAEVLIIRNMHEAGWKTDHTVLSPTGQLELNMEIETHNGTTLTFTGHPDGICSHEKFTNNMLVPLECKSMSEDRGQLTEEHGIAVTYPDYIVQIGLYGRILFQEKLVDHPTRGVFGLMDREGTPMAPQRVPWKDDVIDTAIDKIVDAISMTENGELPDRPYEVSSFECRYCPYHNLCWGEPPPPERDARKKERLTPEDPTVVQAIKDWAQMEPRLTEIKGILESASREADNADLNFEGVTAGYFIPNEPASYNPNRLKDLVPQDILQKAKLPKASRPRFWIRKDRY